MRTSHQPTDTEPCGGGHRLYGFTVLQTLYYFEQFPKDSWLLKTSVRSLLALHDTFSLTKGHHDRSWYYGMQPREAHQLTCSGD